jgi:hypothetical protein
MKSFFAETADYPGSLAQDVVSNRLELFRRNDV